MSSCLCCWETSLTCEFSEVGPSVGAFIWISLSYHPLAFTWPLGTCCCWDFPSSVRNGIVITSSGIIWIKVYIQLLEPRTASYIHVYPCMKYCWESNSDVQSIPILALPTEPLSWSLFSQFRVWEHWPGKMQILFTMLAHVSTNAGVQHRLLSPQSASLATANEPPHIMWWQQRQRLLEQKPAGHEENLLPYWSFPLKAERNGFLLTERKTSACATSKGATSESHLFQRRNSIQDLCTAVHFKWKFKPTVLHSMHGFCWPERQQETNAPIWPHKSITEIWRYTHRRERMINRSVMCKFLFNSKIRLEIAFWRTPCQGHVDFAIVRIFSICQKRQERLKAPSQSGSSSGKGGLGHGFAIPTCTQWMCQVVLDILEGGSTALPVRPSSSVVWAIPGD